MGDWVADAAVRGMENAGTQGSSNMGMIIPAAIGAGAQVAGGVMGGKAQKEASKSQLAAQREALAYQREQQAAEDARYKQAMGIWAAGRAKLAQMYGLTPEDVGVAGLLGGGGPAPAGLAAAPGAAPGGFRPAVMGQGRPTPGTLRDLLISEAPAQGPGDWSNWAQYGLGR